MRFDVGEQLPLGTNANTLARTGGMTAAPPPAATGGDALRELAQRLVPDQALDADDDAQRFAELLAQLCESCLRWLAKGLESRGVFAQEFGAEVTLVFQRSNNPLKSMDLPALTSYLLDWRGDPAPATRKRYLESVLQDLSEHQVAVLAGVKEAIQGIVTRMSPERVTALAKQARGWTKAAKAWNTYRDLHAELRDEQNKLYNEMISPAIQKGYLQQHGEDA